MSGQEKHKIRDFVYKLFGNRQNMQIEGFRGEKEFIEKLVNLLYYVKTNLTTKINISQLPEAEQKEINKIKKEICDKTGEPYVERDYITAFQLCTIRLFSFSKPGIELMDNLSPEELKTCSLSGASAKNEHYPYKYEKSSRESNYKNYNNLTPAEKQEFLYELRSKVISHEYAHNTGSGTESASMLLAMEPFEEIIVERMALNAEGITRRCPMHEISESKQTTATRNIPNIESSNGRIYIVGEVLSKIMGEENLQIARLKGYSNLIDEICHSLNITTSELSVIRDMCMGATDKSLSQEILSKYNLSPEQVWKGKSPEHCRFLVQVKLENKLMEIYSKITLEKLQKVEHQLSNDDLIVFYKDYLDLRASMLKRNDPGKQFTSEKHLATVKTRLDEICKSKGIDPDSIQEIAQQAFDKENDHYINRNCIQQYK